MEIAPNPVAAGVEESATVPAVAAVTQSGFTLTLANFEGPLDLLLSLITRRKLDVTEVALAQVTDEFIAYMHTDTSLASLSEFVVVAAILLDLKVASLLPSEIVEEDDLALLEARDLLFARLLQYRAFKEAAAILRQRHLEESAFRPRQAAMEQRFAQLKPPLRQVGEAEQLAVAAARAFTFAAPKVSVEHLHHPAVSVASQVSFLQQRLTTETELSFQQLAHEAPDRPTVIALFLAILELFKTGAVDLMQLEPMADVTVRARNLEAATLAHDRAAQEDSVDIGDSNSEGANAQQEES